MLRKIVEIDRQLCNGCGLCLDACAEGALALDEENKAVLAKEICCDGLGHCLDVCPTGALRIVERETPAEVAVRRTVRVCEAADKEPGELGPVDDFPCSELSQWPVQLHLISPHAPYFKEADLLVAADCTAFARASFHSELLKGRKLVVACPKLDDTSPYLDKLAQLFACNQLRSITVARMTVPCCGGLAWLVEQAVKLAGVDTPVRTVIIGLNGEVVSDG
ncbi:MAG: 4Fe-4S dicluster domain-containing protein [Thermoleophilia bacterium]|nr:4Fe-4S dicluster domain-containing protein [Thermoleophilia bacterium]